jgi:hypothetical protein
MSDKTGIFRVEIIDGDCKYTIGPLELKAITNMDVYMSQQELTICENVTSPIQLWSYSELSAPTFNYQWQKDGKDILQEKYNNFAPSTPGLYSIRVTAGNCSATSAPVTVKVSPDNKIRDYLLVDDRSRSPIKTDSIFLCSDYSFNFGASLGTTNLYKNGTFVSNNNIFPISESGTYFVQKKIAQNCTVESKPLYISFGKVLKPLNFLETGFVYNYCTQTSILLDDPNLIGNNRLKIIYPPYTAAETYTYGSLYNYYQIWGQGGKNIFEYETGTCKSPPTTIEIKKRYPITDVNGHIIDKKVSLCANGFFPLKMYYYDNDEVLLYRNDTLIQRKAAKEKKITFIASQKGKYYFKIVQNYCTPSMTFVSDTVEIDAPAPVETSVTLITENCNTGQYKLSAKEYSDYTYSWYQNGNIIPNQNTPNLELSKKESGTYYAVLQKGLCSVTTQSIEIGTRIIGSTAICEGSKFSLATNVKDGVYLWKGPNNFTSNQSDFSIDSIRINQKGWYILSVTKDGCTLKDSVNLTITENPQISFDFANPICLNQNVAARFTGTPGYYNINYSILGSETVWKGFYIPSKGPNEKYVNLGKIAPKGYTPQFNMSYSGCSFPLAVPPHAITSEGCKDIFEFKSLKKVYCIKEKITLKFNLPTNLPAGKKLKLNLETYWDKYDLGSFSADSIQFIMPDVSSDYMFFTVEDENHGFIGMSEEFNVKGRRPDVYAFIGGRYTSGPVMQCEGFSTKLTSFTNNSTSQFIQWKKNGLNIPGATKADFEAKESGIYTLAMTDQGCIVESSSINVKQGQIPKPEIQSLTGLKNACSGFFVPLSESANFPYTSFEWKRSNRLIEKKSDREAFEAKASGYYTLTAYQGSCKATSDSIEIEIGEYLPNRVVAYGTTELAKNKVTICDQTKATFYSPDYYFPSAINESDSVLAAKYGFSFQWKRNDKNIDRANYSSYQSGEPGIYSLQVKQGDCIVNSNRVEVVKQNTLSVRLLSTYNYSALNPKDTLTVCKGSNIDIYAYQQYEAMYRWNKELYKDGKLIQTYSAIDQSNYSNYFSIKESGKYSIKLYPDGQKNCIAYTDSSNILFVDKTFNLPLDTVIACADSVYLYPPNMNGLSNTYQWSFKNKVISTSYSLIAPFEEGVYTVEVKQSRTCGAIQPVLVQKKINPIIWTGSDNPNGLVSFCNDKDNILYINNVNNSTFEWYRNQQKLPDTLSFVKASQAGEYLAKVRYKDCAATSNIVKVDLLKIKNQISPLADSLAICLNGGFQNLNAVKETGYTYEWFKDNKSLQESSSSIKATQQGSYRALIQSGDCSVLTPAIKIYPSTQLPTATISGDTTLNIGDTANLKLSFTSSPPFTYKLNNNQEGTSDKTTIIHPVKIEEATIFKLASVKNACGEGTVSGEAKIQVIILANEPLIGHRITIAPVPAESYCEIIIDLPISQEVSYQLLDMKGQQLSEKNLGNVTYKKQYLNLNHLIAGEYLIRVQVGKDVVTRKLIKY